MLAVYAPKGGIGCTTIAGNLAAALAQAHRKQVVIVDLDLQYGDVTQLFRTTTDRGSIIDVLSVPVVELDMNVVGLSLSTTFEEIKILAAPPRPELAEVVDAAAAQLGVVLSILRFNFDFVVVDLGRHIGDAGATVLEACDQLLLLTAPLTAALRSLRLARGLLENLHIDDGKVEVVLNQVDEHSNFRSDEIVEAAGFPRPFLATIPHDSRVAVSALDSGEPFVLFRQRSAISSAVMRLTDLVAMSNRPVEVST